MEHQDKHREEPKNSAKQKAIEEESSLKDDLVEKTKNSHDEAMDKHKHSGHGSGHGEI
ncbi:hypothetical protein [Salinimicrobium xinjiangense]|uniref:hypothetical protein n=1 Tax=Salinimicrobium xinjiangense TaxID=438596 RepID=UPI00040EAA2F|nr:hypothetical protein [Salinimicrobium xinjiangense]